MIKWKSEMRWPQKEMFKHLKPKVLKKGSKWHVVRNKYGSTRSSFKSSSFDIAIKHAIVIFRGRILGRAIRYERLRRLGIKEAQ